MKAGFYSRIGKDNIVKNPRLYVPRILAEGGLLACFYIAFTLANDKSLLDLRGGDYVQFFMVLGTAILGLLSFIIILYVNSFLMKQRKSEYGLYNVLGMEKKHIVRVLFAESFFTSFLSIVLGLGFGMLFYKLCSLLICRLLQSDIILGFDYIKAGTLLPPALIFITMDFLAFIVNAISVGRLKPVELLKESHTGEKEPKVKWVMLIIGTVTLLAGYFLALSVKSSMSALSYFFPAVILVIIGTYFLFITGSIFVLKALKANKKYYYNKRHMPVVSGLLYRMKQNAVGLASIAILATGILIMISTTVSLYVGMQEALDKRYPCDLYLSALEMKDGTVSSIDSRELSEIILKAANDHDLEITSIETEQYLSVTYLLRDGKLLTKTEVTGGFELEELTGVTYITLDLYNEMMNHKMISSRPENLILADDELVICCVSEDSIISSLESLVIAGKNYTVKQILNYFPISDQMQNVVNSIGIIVANDEVMADIYEAQKDSYGEYASEYTDRIAVSFKDEQKAEKAADEFNQSIFDAFHTRYENFVGGTLDTKWEAKVNLVGMYGAFLFLGIILGIVCLFSTILITYYKQISEGYEDRERYQIMEKIGMEEIEVLKIIRLQMTMQFFLPLLTAGIHTAVAFPMLLKLLKLLMLPNKALAIVCALVTYAFYAVVYIVIYIMTSKTYYKIVH